LNELPALYEQIKELRKNQMLQLTETKAQIGKQYKQLNEIWIDPSEAKSYMAHLIGFFMVQKELERQIPHIQDMNQLWIDAGKLIETELDVPIHKFI
jgi:hypothetical protein